jgi:hypothetical protein
MVRIRMVHGLTAYMALSLAKVWKVEQFIFRALACIAKNLTA